DSGKNSQVFLKKSSDYGNSFGSASVLSDQNSLCNSVNGLVATGSNVYIFFNCYDVSAQQGSIVFRASNDNATSFGKPIVLFKGKGIYSNGFLSTAAEGKNVYVVSEENFPVTIPDSVLFRRSNDGGNTFSETVDLSDNKNSH